MPADGRAEGAAGDQPADVPTESWTSSEKEAGVSG